MERQDEGVEGREVEERRVERYTGRMWRTASTWREGQ